MNRLPWEAKKAVFDLCRYKPTPLAEVIHRAGERFLVVGGGVSSGKTYLLAGEMAPHLFWPIPNDEIFILAGPDFETPRREFDVLLEMLQTTGIVGNKESEDYSRPRQGSWWLEAKVKGKLIARLETKTLKDPVSIRTWNCAGIGVCEAGGVDLDAWQRLWERVIRTGGFIIGAGTFEQTQPWYKNLWREAQKPEFIEKRNMRSFSLPTWANTYKYPLGEQDPEIEVIAQNYGGRGAALFLERVAGIIQPVLGLVVPEFSYVEHVRECEWHGGPVQIFIDPGMSTGAYSVLAVQRGEVIKEDDSIEEQTQIFDEIWSKDLVTEDIIQECMSRDWWHGVMETRRGVIDIAGTQRRVEGTKEAHTVVQQWRKDAHVRLKGRRIQVEEGVSVLRGNLGYLTGGQPRLIVSPRCKALIYELCGEGQAPYPGMQPWRRRQYPDGTYGEPLERHCDAAKALIYGLVDWFGKSLKPARYRSRYEPVFSE